MPVITAYGNIKKGKLTLANRKRFEQDLSGCKDGVVELTVKARNQRSSPQNRYYWGVVVKEVQIRFRELGNDVTPELTHEFLKGKFNLKPLIGEGGEVIDNIGGPTPEMNKEEFSEYVDKIIIWAADVLQIVIPYPNEKLILNL